MIAGTKKILRYPVLLFVVIGALLYVFYSEVTRVLENNEKQIIVSANEVDLLKVSFEKTWNRPPTDSELKARVDNYIMDEVFFREAISMGLDKKDPAVKRRLRQIIEMMLDNYTTVYPVQSQLEKYLSENPEKFRLPSTISFEHIYFKEDEKEVAENQLKRLSAGKQLESGINGELLMVPSDFSDNTKGEIERIFGKAFTSELFTMEVGNWDGPIESAYGWHLIKIDQITGGIVPALTDIRAVVEREWMVVERKKMKSEQYEQMKSYYNISVTYPPH